MTRALARAGAVFLAAAAVMPSAAQDASLPPPTPIDGLPAGPFFLKPSLGLGVAKETNPFYATDADAQSDVVARAMPKLSAMLPFSNSYFLASYDGIFRHYDTIQVNETTSTALVGELSLQFASRDRLVVFADRAAGASEVQRFDGGERTYDGTPYRYNIYGMGAERDVPGHLGYKVVGAWSHLDFDAVDVSFFEFKGYDATGDAHVPISSTLWIVAGVGTRRYDHHRTDDPPGVVFRQENADRLRCGVRGEFANRSWFEAVLAYDDARYPGGAGSDHKGVLGDASLVYPLGPSLTLTVDAARSRWSSFFGDNNYYISNTIGGGARRSWPGGSNVGGSVRVGTSAYPDPLSIAAGGPKRRDDFAELQAYATLNVRRFLGFRVSYTGQFRSSNDPTVEYDAQTVAVQMVVGWP